MSSISAGLSDGTALVSTGDTTGQLVLKTNGGTTAVTIGTDQSVTLAAGLTTASPTVFPAGTASLPAITTTGDTNTGIYFPAADNIGFATNGVIRGRWTTDGLCFGSDTAAANALDDYEEGTWTPEVADATTGGNTATGTFSGNYTKIGSVVVVNCFLNNIVTTGMTSGNPLFVRNLPFTSGSQFSQSPPFFDRITFSGYAIAVVVNSVTHIDFRECVSNAGDNNLTVSDINVSGTSDIAVSITYLTF